ncbi:hypothetical protein M405DRAFT_816209 [Rhizopogon salebrosus TDB-379]|nr:hypothetical protein M405DRAFT_816209 [Rhizopogon salebrosus TDB-379]
MPRNGQFLHDYVGRMLRKSCAHTYALFKRVRCEPDQFAVHVGHNHIASVPRLGDFPLRYAAKNPVGADNLYDQYVFATGSGVFERKTAVSVSRMLSIQVILGSEQ